jgi:hypothetical protein
VSITNSTASNNTTGGVLVQAANSGVISAAEVSDITASNNAGVGVYTISQLAGAITEINLSDITASSNAERGVYVIAQTTGDIGEVTLEDVIAQNNTGANGRGIEIGITAAGSTIGTATIEDITVTGNAQHGLFVNNTSSGLIDTITVDGVSATGNAGVGVYLLGTSSGLVNSASLSDVTASGNANTGINVTLTSGADLGSLDIDDATVSGNTTASGRGIYVEVNGAGSTLTTANISNVAASSNGASGLFVTSASNGLVSTLNVSNVSSNQDDSRGIYLLAQTGGDIGTITADNLTATNIGGAAGRGMEIIANGAGSVITSSTVTNSTFNTNASIGFLYQAINSGVFTAAAINNSSAAANTGRGIYILAQADGDYGTVSLDNITVQNNTGAGGYGVQFLVTGAGSTVNSATLDNITASGNSLPGISGSATVSGSISSLSISDANVTTSGFSGGIVVDANASAITSVEIRDSTSSGNTTRGVYVIAQGGGTISGLTVDNVTAQNNTGASGIGVNIVASGAASTLGATTLGNSLISGNAQAGVYVQGAGTSIMSGVNIHDVTSTANTTNGVYVDDDTTAGFVVDMGGGALGSTGNNRIFSNTGTELRVDLDGGELKAENNWWGVGTGLAGGEITLEVGSTVDSTPFLAADPGP